MGDKPDLPEWQNSLSIFPGYKLVRADSAKADGYYDYTLSLTLNYQEKEEKQGDFVIKTNHPKLAELKIRGLITKKPE